MVCWTVNVQLQGRRAKLNLFSLMVTFGRIMTLCRRTSVELVGLQAVVQTTSRLPDAKYLPSLVTYDSLQFQPVSDKPRG